MLNCSGRAQVFQDVAVQNFKHDASVNLLDAQDRIVCKHTTLALHVPSSPLKWVKGIMQFTSSCVMTII